ncbi:DUF551 domain-containing protein [Citrobacter freundii]|uniref:DUF551 domain-containing protein n=1 Tax=Citrobacter freundii TaxID=546 RepID=UPI0023B1659C|nr:DUF551 domain-containing protein [Citrobacter freundii]
MSTITKERVKDILEFGAGRIISPITDDEIMELARIAQASLEAEPVGEVVLGEFDDCGCHPDARVVCIAADGQADWANFKDGTRLYTAPPAPVSVPDAIEPTVEAIKLVLPTSNPDEYAACIGADMWNACRAAMLQGAENAWSPTTMKTAPAMGSSPKIAEATSGNSPVIPDGWVACSERMPDNRGKSRELYVCWGTYFDGAEPDYIPALFFIHPTNGWCEWEPLEDDCDPKKVVITHWMPMPAAPLQEAE